MKFLQISWNLLSIIGAATTIYGLLEIYARIKNWRIRVAKRQEIIAMLKATDHFIAHVCLLGGEGSKTYSVEVEWYEENIFLNPWREYISIGFNRGGDYAIISPSQLSKEQGFGIKEIQNSDGEIYKPTSPTFGHLHLHSPRTDYFVTFKKVP